MRESMPGRPDPTKTTYNPGARREPSEMDRLVADARAKLTEWANDPSTQLDEFAIAAAAVERRQDRLRDAAWHHARIALGG